MFTTESPAIFKELAAENKFTPRQRKKGGMLIPQQQRDKMLL